MRTITIIIVLIMTIRYAEALPQDSISYLKAERLSLLEWGAFRMSQDLNAAELFDGSLTVNFYQDELLIIGMQSSNGKESSESFCKNAISKIKKYLKILPQNGGKTMVAIWFASNSFDRPQQPENLGRDLEAITKIRIISKKAKENVTCDSRLLDDKIEINKEIN